MDTVIRCFHFGAKGEAGQAKSLQDALHALIRPGFVWIDIQGPTREALEPLVGSLRLNRLSIEDCIDDNQIPKVENYEHYTFLLFNSYVYRDRAITVGETDFILGKKFLVTVHGLIEGTAGFFAGLDDHLRHALAQASASPDALMQEILDYMVDRKFEAIETIQDEIDGYEETLLADAGEFRPAMLLDVRRNLLKLRKSLYHEREVFIKICRRDSPYIAEESIYAYRDIYDHLAKFFESVEIEREMVTNLLELHMSLVNNRLATASNDINTTMRKLTVITTIFMPLTLIAGVGGMSEFSMMTGPENWRLSYTLFLAGSGAVGLVNYLLLKYLKWV